MPNTQAKKGLFQFYPHNLMWLGLSVLAIVLDQWTKWIASTHLNYADPVPVLPFLNWTLLHNHGAAFSFLSDAGGWQRYFFTSLAGFVSIIFIFWLMKKDNSAFIRQHATEAFNFNFSMFLYCVATLVLWELTDGMLFLILFPVAMVLLSLWIFCPIMAAKAEKNGDEYRYPITIRLLK